MVNKKLTFSSVVRSLYDRFEVRTFPFSHRSAVRGSMRAHPSVLRSRKRLIGRRDRTSIIDRSRYRMEETSFREAVSDGEAQAALVRTR